MANKHDKLSDLRSKIGATLVRPEPVEAPQTKSPVEKPVKPAPTKEARANDTPPKGAVPPPVAKAPSTWAQKRPTMQFYLSEEDRRLIHSLANWLGGQGERVSDSQVVKIAIRAVKQNSELVRVSREVRALDGRRQPRKKT